MASDDVYRAFDGADITADEVLAEALLVPLDRLGAVTTGPSGRPAVAVEPTGSRSVRVALDGGD